MNAAHLWLCLEWIIRKRAPWEAEAGNSNVSLAVLCLPNAFEVNSLKLARSSSELGREMRRVDGGQSGTLIPTQLSPAQAWIQQIKTALFFFFLESPFILQVKGDIKPNSCSQGDPWSKLQIFTSAVRYRSVHLFQPHTAANIISLKNTSMIVLE